MTKERGLRAGKPHERWEDCVMMRVDATETGKAMLLIKDSGET